MKKISIIALTLLFSSVASAQDFIGEFKNWGVFSTMQDGKKICYATSVPVGKTGNFRKRGEPYILVTLRPGNISEISVNSGFPYKDGSEVDIGIDRKHNFKFFTSAQTPQMAWAKDSATDTTIVEKMIKGNNVTVKGTSKIGTYAIDTYRLTGFTSAINKMKDSCK